MKLILKNKFRIIAAVFLLVQLVLFYFVKYSNQGLSVSEFSLSNKGNIFNLLIILTIITGLFFQREKKSNKLSQRQIITFIVILYFTLAVAFIGTKIDLPGKNTYLLDQPLDKIISSLLFVIYFIVQFTFLSLITIAAFRKSKPSVIRSIINSFLMLFMFLLISFVFITNKNFDSGKWTLSKEKGNLALVLGAAVWSYDQPSPSLSSRVDRAIELYEKGFVEKIFLTGSNAPGELAEATVAFNYAVSKGMDTTIFLMETQTGSTNQQVHFIKENLYGKENINQIIIVSDAYHLPRVLEICKFYNLDVRVAASNHQMHFKDKLLNNLRETVALLSFLCFAL
jgi:vancomycin permeability regulator SanA